jgi:protein TonB
MFEDSTFESNGRIRTRSRRWMLAALLINGSILLTMILIPLIYPEALPRIAMLQLMAAPMPMEQPKPVRPPNATVVRPSIHPDGSFTAPRSIPNSIVMPSKPEVLADVNLSGLEAASRPVGADNPFGHATPQPTVRQAPPARARISGMVEAGLLLYRKTPLYPAIAIASRTQGTVVLQATISKSGTIENLRVASGPAMLQQAALDAVKDWRYRPYTLSGEPVEVETTINVVFTLGQ